jgi:hypothetical protein
MLKRLRVKGFKSLADVELHFPRLTVLFGPNAAGKSNILDAVLALSRIGTSRTLFDALQSGRGYPFEAFSLPAGGLPALVAMETVHFTLETDLQTGKELYRYGITVELQPKSGALAVRDEHLIGLSARGEPRGTAAIETADNVILLRRKSHPGRPRKEPLGENYALLSDPRLGGAEYRAIGRVRSELLGWWTYYLDPRVAMRAAQPPANVPDIGVLGGTIAPFLYRLRAEKPKHFEALKRTLHSLVPAVEELGVNLDENRAILDVFVQQAGRRFSSRVISEGTLRVLALCAIAVNPWSGPLITFEEPENGVHPRRIERIAQLLTSLAIDQDRQIIVTTHSPLLCDAMLEQAKTHPRDIALMNVREGAAGTEVRPFEMPLPLFKQQDIAAALTAAGEERVFENLILRGMIDE